MVTTTVWLYSGRQRSCDIMVITSVHLKCKILLRSGRQSSRDFIRCQIWKLPAKHSIGMTHSNICPPSWTSCRAVFFISRPAGHWRPQWPLVRLPTIHNLKTSHHRAVKPQWLQKCGGPHSDDVLSVKVTPPIWKLLDTGCRLCLWSTAVSSFFIALYFKNGAKYQMY